jgi:hypothetical protein
MKPSLKIISALTAGALALGGATALASVTVYNNDMSTQSEFNEILRSGGGKRCDKKYREKSKVMLVSVKKSPTTCSFRPPVQGDRELPNQSFGIEAKLLKKTPKSMRAKAFFEVTIRAGGSNTGYTLRVFPQKHRYELSRRPAGGGFPAKGKSNAIKGVNERNRIELFATGAEIRAMVNGEEIAKLNDSNPGQVPGKKLRFAIGSQSDKAKAVAGVVKRVLVTVPDP